MSGGTEAGWHNDPMGRHESRYWDGTQWTEHVADAGVQSVDPLDSAPATPVVDPNQTIVGSYPPAGAAPPPGGGQPAYGVPGAEGLPQYANTGAKKSGGFPIVPVIIGLVVAAVVVGGLIFFIGGGDDDTAFGESTATLDGDNPVSRYDISLDRGEAIRFRAVPRNGGLDPVFAIAMRTDDARALFDDLTDEDFLFSDAEFTDVFSDVADDTLSDLGSERTGIERGELHELERFDDSGSGGTEVGGFVSPRSATYTLLLYDYDGERGDLDVQIDRWDGRLEFSDFSAYVDNLDGVFTEDFFTEFSDFDDLSDFSDFTDDDFGQFSDFSDDPFSDFSDFDDPFSDFSEFSDFSDFSDFVDPFTDLFSDLFSEFSDLPG